MFRSRPAMGLLPKIAAIALALIGLAVLLNGSFFSSWSAIHVDLSINLVAAHALADGDNPYGLTTLAERAESLGSPTNFIYSQLFTSYIQPPTSALSLLPLTALPWREATRVYLVLNHVFLLAAVGLTLLTLRVGLSNLWILAGAALILAGFSQINGSFSLGQVDALILLLLAISFWAYTRGYAAVAGASIAIGAAIKLIPALLLLYFLWKRDYRAAAWGFGVGAVLFLASLAFVGFRTYEFYITESLPALLKGSTHFTNASLGALVARVFTDGGPNEIYSLSEVPSDTLASITRLSIGLLALAFLAFVIPHGERDRDEKSSLLLLPEFYLVVAVALAISSVTWEFYVIWLIPVFLAAFLSPRTFLPRPPVRWALLAGFLVAFVLLNYPGDCGQSPQCYLFEPNSVFYHPEWVPGVWVERRIGLYANHPDAVLYVRLAGLLLVCGLLTGLVLLRKAGDSDVPTEGEPLEPAVRDEEPARRPSAG